MSDKELIVEAGKHVPYAAIMDDAKRCMHCADEWPCVTRRLADALEAATSERDAALAAIERVKETLSLHNPNGRLVKEVLAALEGAPEPEVEELPIHRTEAGTGRELYEKVWDEATADVLGNMKTVYIVDIKGYGPKPHSKATE